MTRAEGGKERETTEKRGSDKGKREKSDEGNGEGERDSRITIYDTIQYINVSVYIYILNAPLVQ